MLTHDLILMPCRLEMRIKPVKITWKNDITIIEMMFLNKFRNKNRYLNVYEPKIDILKMEELKMEQN